MLNNPELNRHRGLLAWGMLVVLLLALVFFAILPLLQLSMDYSQRIETGYQQLARFRQIANGAPEFMSEYQRVQQQGLDKLFYPAGMTSAQVAKELQKHLTTVITRDSGVLISSEVVAEQPREDAEANSVYERVMVKAVFQSSPALLREVLHQAYRARPLMFVESLDIKPLEGLGEDKQIVKAEVRISTYWRGGEVKHEETD
ncbi:MAG: type II secretion system protein M [Gammaproteobacteria bacterium]|nr:type II secretion system protein M [Gammaproteobacteria bacterium]MBU1722392.1 type II secretion system protein M [Gammaproteobacteria bacterium]MBU2004671.1 type II secretion system protein M [Gammaproteobacteria bacterium]